MSDWVKFYFRLFQKEKVIGSGMGVNLSSWEHVSLFWGGNDVDFIELEFWNQGQFVQKFTLTSPDEMTRLMKLQAFG